MKEELLQFDGVVTEIVPDARYRVQLDVGHSVVAYTAGKMKKNRIKTLAGDRVTIENYPNRLEKGRLVFVTRTNGPQRVGQRGGDPCSGAGETYALPIQHAGVCSAQPL